MTLWEIDIYPAPGQPDLSARAIAADAADLGIVSHLELRAARGFLLQGELDPANVQRIADELLADSVIEKTQWAPVNEMGLQQAPVGFPCLVHVLPKPGVTDAVAQSALKLLRGEMFMRDRKGPVEAVRTLRKYWLPDLDAEVLDQLCSKLLANDSIEQVVVGPLRLEQLQSGVPYQFERVEIRLRQADDEQLMKISRDRQLSLTLVEMQTIRDHFRQQDRDPTDAELETLAQTWSEHCSHKTLTGGIRYRDENGERVFENLLKETIFAATQQIRRDLPRDWEGEDWCVSVFEDNAGVVRFDQRDNLAFKVETHNRPSALEPYGGANTGIGGVIRDILGVGLGARPLCNTDVFCFAPPNQSPEQLPPGVLHPRRIMKGVVAGVRDYGNRMGIPTVNGAVFFDARYVGNPLVFCGTLGLLPHDKSFKTPQPDDLIVALGGRTGRDGIHGATFSSAELTSQSESVSGGAVQIGNAITEKMLLDVLLAARDQNLYNAVTDCGAGGFSSAVGEMGQTLCGGRGGAEVWLDRAPLKYEGLSYTEIWISEAQERMVLSVDPSKWDALSQLCRSEGVEAVVIGKFTPTGRLRLRYQDQPVADLCMDFLHKGRPPIVREAVYQPRPAAPLTRSDGQSTSWPISTHKDYTPLLKSILGALNVCSKEWIIRQYDHEVQGGSVIKPLMGAGGDGPSDASVIRPRLDSYRGVTVACGMNPHYGDFDPYHMAAASIDEAVRNCVAVGADPGRIAILDNFCWGYTDRPETLGSLVRAALACKDMAQALGAPFISGKDSLHNEFSYENESGQRVTISIPPTLLISAMGIVPDVRQCVSMDFKSAGNLIYQIGETRDELGGSHFSLVEKLQGGRVPQTDGVAARRTFQALYQVIQNELVRSCHDLSEGGLAVCAAEMAFAGNFGAKIYLSEIPYRTPLEQPHDVQTVLMFAESSTRFLCEVPPEHQRQFERILDRVPHHMIGEVTADDRLEIIGLPAGQVVRAVNDVGNTVVSATLADLKEAWQAPLRW